MSLLIDNINKTLAEWNPLSVPPKIALIEYTDYIPLILKSINNKEELRNCLEDIVISKLEVGGYDSTNKEHLADIERVSDKIINIYNTVRD
jgi:hypothetical protein